MINFENEEFYSIPDLAIKFGKCDMTIRRWAKKYNLKYCKVGSMKYFNAKTLQDLMNNNI